MASFDDAIARMKALYTYGKDLNENKTINSYTIEHKAEAADGKTYGIIKECNKYYIKVAQNGKETLAEGYNYLGGFCNKSNYEYESYNKALKNFELKLASINEAYEGNAIISTIDPFKKGDFIVEGTEKMQNEIARQRQIMYNVGMLLNESTEFGISRRNDTAMYNGKNPEAETGKRGDEDLTETNANPEYKGSKTNGVDKKVGPFDKEPGNCEDQLKESCDCGESNCKCDWASKGLPSTPGVGEADTDHNNDPFNKSINEEEEVDSEVENVEGEEMEGADDIDIDVEGEGDIEFGPDYEDELGSEELESEDELDAEDLDSEVESDEDILARISELESELESLRSQISGEESEIEGEDFDGEDLEGDDFEGEDLEGEDFEGEDLEGEDFEGEDLEGEDLEGEEMTDFESDFDNVDDSEFEDDEEMSLMERKNSYLNYISEKVAKEILKEEKLNDFGKHPGYRKKPFNLPKTGEDKNQWGEDWNDESVYSEEPFGTKIGDSAPFNILVDAVTKDVMATLSGDAFKKKMK